MENSWRLIIDPGNSGFFNMASDEALLLNYSRCKIPVLRIYCWESPWISLGYNQDASRVLVMPPELPFVRRITGGAAIVHDQEIAYSIVCSASDLDLPFSVKRSFAIIASFLKEFYCRLGIDAEFAGENHAKDLSRWENFCFSSWEHFDFIAANKKIGGNAQRRKGKVIFQHGSIPQNIDFALVRRTVRDPGALEGKATFLDQLLGRKTHSASLKDLLAQSFAHTFGVDFIDRGILAPEIQLRNSLLENKYEREEWNLSRNEKPAAIKPRIGA